MRTRLSLLIAVAVALVAVLVAAPSASAAACNFQNAMAGNWNLNTNWDCGVVPGAGDTVTIDGGETVTVTGAQSAASITLTNGNIAFSGGSVTAGSASIDSSNMTGTSSPTGFTVTGATTKQTGGTWLIRSGPQVVLNGAVTHTAGQVCIDDASNTGDPLVTLNSTWTISSTADIACASNMNSAGLRVGATGTLAISDDTTVSTPVDNDGTVDVNGGTLTLQSTIAGDNQTGNWLIADGATLFFNGSAPHLTAGAITADGAGPTGILRTDADLTMDNGVAMNVEDFRQSGGTFTLAGTTPVPTPNAVSQTGGTHTGSRNWTVGTLSIDSATWANGSFTTTVTGATSKQTGGTWLIRSGPQVVLNGAVTHTAGQVCIDDASNTGDPLVTLNSTWTISSTADIACASNLDGPAFKVNGTGSFLAGDAGTKSITTPVENAGNVTAANAQTLNFDGGLTQTGGTTQANSGGTIGGPVTVQGGTLKGTGTYSGAVTNSGGTVAPGASPGTLTLGSFTQGPAGTLQIDVTGTTPGTEFDVLTVNGAANLDGTLAVVQGGGFAPQVSDTFRFMTSTSRTGTFSSITGAAAPGNLTYQLDYPADSQFGAQLVLQPPAKPSNQTLPSVSGTAQVGQTLHCDPGTWTGSPGFTFEWRRDGSPIGGATSQDYTATDADAGHTLTCRVTATNTGGSDNATSAGVGIPVPAPANTGSAPSVPASATEGDSLTCDPGGWSGSPTFGFEWLRDGTAIPGATSQSYTLVSSDVGHEIKCRVTASNAGGSNTATSGGVTPAAKPVDAPSPTSPPKLPASGHTGDTLTCDPGTWTGSPTFAFQWLRDGTAIAGATSSTYKLTDADVGHNITCRVTATNAGGSTVRTSGALLVAGVKIAGETLRGEEAFTQGTSNDVYLACTKLDLLLIDVVPKGAKKVSVLGAADERLVGKSADILLGKKKVGSAKIGPGGSFSATVAAPPANKRRNAQYQARVDTTLSQKLHLERRMIATTLAKRGANLVLSGVISKPFAKKPVAIQVERYLSCQQRQKVDVAKVTPDRRGRFSVTIPLPDGVKSAIYRALTRVATRTGGPAKAPTFTLPRAVDI